MHWGTTNKGFQPSERAMTVMKYTGKLKLKLSIPAAVPFELLSVLRSSLSLLNTLWVINPIARTNFENVSLLYPDPVGYFIDHPLV